MLLHLAASFYILLFHISHSLPSTSLAIPEYSQLSRRVGSGPLRPLFLVNDAAFNIAPRTVQVPQADGSVVTTTVQAGHGFLWWGGTAVDGPMRIEQCMHEGKLILRVWDYGLAHNADPIGAKPGRTKIQLADSTLRNHDLLDPARGGGGGAYYTLMEDPVYRIGADHLGNINDCYTYLKRLLIGASIPISAEAQNRFYLQDLWYYAFRPGDQVASVRIAAMGHVTPLGQGSEIRVYDIPDENACQQKTKRESSCLPPTLDPEVGDPTDDESTLALDPIAKEVPPDMLLLNSQDDLTTKDAPISVVDFETQVTTTRAGGVLSNFITVSKDTLAKLGALGNDLVGPLFIILEFVAKSWKMAGIGAINIAATVAAGFAASGPVGWFVDAAIAIFFFILPGLFENADPPAKITDVQGIIQWKFFGNATHTGNELCQQGSPGIPGNPNCQAQYGTGTLSQALGLDNFDALVFLWNFNQGYAMTIKDMAAAFYVIDPDKPGDGSDKVATINCHNSKGSHGGLAGIVGADNPTLCNHPEFLINRALIDLPWLGETADKVYNRIIPAPNGDCIMVVYPGSLYFASLNTTYSGLPCTIIANEQSNSSVAGTMILPGFANGSSDTSTQTGSLSVSPQNAIPPESPFTPLDPTHYTCLSYGKSSLCLPPGTYPKQSGLGFEIKQVDTLTFPSPGPFNLSIHFQNAQLPRATRPAGVTDHSYTSNQTPPASSKTFYAFAADMEALDTNTDNQATFTISPPVKGATGPDPTCCFFTAISYGGNVWCAGPGIGDLPLQWQDLFQSVNCYSGGQAKISAGTYADWDASAPEVGILDDFSTLPYGPNKETYTKNVKAVWIYST